MRYLAMHVVQPCKPPISIKRIGARSARQVPRRDLGLTRTKIRVIAGWMVRHAAGREKEHASVQRTGKPTDSLAQQSRAFERDKRLGDAVDEDGDGGVAVQPALRSR